MATDLVALVAEHVALKRSGRGFLGLCPFHQEKTPSFRVDPERGWYCHGEGRGGDEISFVMQLAGCSFPEALHHLAERAGIQPRKLAPGSIRRAIDERQRRRQEHQAQLSAVRQRWRTAIRRHDDIEGLCFALGVAERRDPERRLELTRSLFEQYGWAISLRAKVERELDAIELEERELREQPLHAVPRALAGAA